MILDRNSDFLIFEPKLWILNQKCDFLKRIYNFRKIRLTTKLRFFYKHWISSKFWFLTENSFFDGISHFSNFYFWKNLPAANSTSIESVEEPDMFNLLRGVKFSIFCIFVILWFRCFNFIKVAYYLKIFVKNWFQGQMISIGVNFFVTC